MSKVYGVLIVLLLVGIAGGLIFLATWDIPPPLHTVDKDVSSAAIPRKGPPLAPAPTGFGTAGTR